MKIINLSEHNSVYTCNVYLVTGDFNALGDVNTLVDAGRDSRILGRIMEASTGVGKKRIEQVILTHGHYDHAGMVGMLKEKFDPIVYAYSNALDNVDEILEGGERLKIGDRMFEVVYTPGHSNDSICLYNAEEKVLFSGDTNLVVSSTEGSYEKGYVEVIKDIARLDIETIYPGHGNPLLGDCRRLLRTSLSNILHSKIL